MDFRIVLEALSDAIVVADESGRVLYVNRATEMLLGFRSGELTGQPLTTIMPHRLRAAHHEGFERYVRTRAPRIMGQPIRVPALRSDGAEIEIDLTLSTLPIGDGKELFIGSLRDLRDRVQLERQLSITRYMRSAADAARLLSARLDAPAVLTTAIEAMANGFGVTRAEIWLYDPPSDTLYLRASAGALFSTDPIGGPRIPLSTSASRLAEVARTRERFLGRAEASGGELHEIGGLGDEHTMAVYPLVAGGDLLGVLYASFSGSIEDEVFQVMGTFASTVANAINDAFARARAEALAADLQRAVRVRDDFLSIVSHELKTPLTSIDLQVQLMLRRAEQLSSEQVILGLQRIERQESRLKQLIDELLNATRIASGKLELVLEEVDLGVLLRDVADRLLGQAREAGCTIAIIAEPGISGRWDRARLDHTLTNLVSNAIKYGAGKPVELVAEACGPMVRAIVRDHGIGIAPEYHARIFERFERAVRSDEYGGFGLGLWIARQMVETMGGTIGLVSEPGRGTTFTVELPQAPLDPR